VLIEQAVYEILAANASLIALCPAARIFPDSEIQNVQLPSIKHRVINDQSLYTHTGRAELRHAEFYQVAVYAVTMAEVRAIAEAVIDALSGVHVVSSDGLHGFHMNTNPIPYDEDVRCCGLALDFELWYGD